MRVRAPPLRVSTQRIIENAACSPQGWELFVSDVPAIQRAATLICATCPVREACLDHHYLDQGTVVGGTTWAQRRQSLQDLDYPETVSRQLDSIFQGVLGVPRMTALGLQSDLVAKLRVRHGPALSEVA